MASDLTKIQNGRAEHIRELRRLREEIWPDSVDPTYKDIVSTHEHRNQKKAAMRIRGIEKFYFSPDDTQDSGQSKRVFIHKIKGEAAIESFFETYLALDQHSEVPAFPPWLAQNILSLGTIVIGDVLDMSPILYFGITIYVFAETHHQMMQTSKFYRFISSVREDLSVQNPNAWGIMGVSDKLTAQDVQKLTTVPFGSIKLVYPGSKKSESIDLMTVDNPSLAFEAKRQMFVPLGKYFYDFLFSKKGGYPDIWTAADTLYYRDQEGEPNLMIIVRTSPSRPQAPQTATDTHPEQSIELKQKEIPLHVNSW